MRSFEKAKESWEMDQEEKIEQAKVCKERGTTFFKQNKYRLAVKQYKKIIDLLQYDSGEFAFSFAIVQVISDACYRHKVFR